MRLLKTDATLSFPIVTYQQRLGMPTGRNSSSGCQRSNCSRCHPCPIFESSRQSGSSDIAFSSADRSANGFQLLDRRNPDVNLKFIETAKQAVRYVHYLRMMVIVDDNLEMSTRISCSLEMGIKAPSSPISEHIAVLWLHIPHSSPT